jgi:pyridoxine 4-dehydrogenase
MRLLPRIEGLVGLLGQLRLGVQEHLPLTGAGNDHNPLFVGHHDVAGIHVHTPATHLAIERLNGSLGLRNGDDSPGKDGKPHLAHLGEVTNHAVDRERRDPSALSHGTDVSTSNCVVIYVWNRALPPTSPTTAPLSPGGYSRPVHTPEITASASGSWTLGDLTVNRMGFGSMRITANPDPELAITVLRRAIELGVNHIDTAAFYVSPGGTLGVGTGPIRHATELIRKALAPYPQDLVIATKVGPGDDPSTGFYQATTPAQLRSQVEENLRSLGRDHLDVVNLRIIKRPGDDSVAERFGALAELRDAGLIRHLGLSNVRLDHLDEAQAIAPVVCVQNSYAVDLRRDDDELLRICGERGIAFVPFFAIAGAPREQGAATDHSEAIRTVARAHRATPYQVRLAWTLHQGPHVLAIPGTGDPDHLVENIAAGALRLTADEVAALG